MQEDNAAPDEAGLEAALDDLQSALQEHRDYLDSVAADYLLSLPLAVRKRLDKVHETYARAATAGATLRSILTPGHLSSWRWNRGR